MSKVKYGWMCDTDFNHEFEEDNIGCIDLYPNKELFLRVKESHFKGVPDDAGFVCSPVKVKIELVGEG